MGLLDSFFSKKDSQQKEPAPDYIPPVTATKNPKAAEELAATAATLLQRGITSGSKDLMREALANADRALALDPDCYNAIQFKVAILIMLDKDNRDNLLAALACSERALTLEKENASMWFNKAGILENLGRYEEAIAAYDRSLACTPRSPIGEGGTLVAKGRTLGKMGRADEAIALFGRVPANDPSYGEALEARGGLLEKKGDREAALAAYREAGRVFLSKRLDSDATECYNRVLALDPSDNEALFRKGASLLNQSSRTHSPDLLAQACACIDAALAKDPHHPGILTAKGRCLLDMNNIEQSLQMFDRALAIRPSDYEALMHKALALMRLMRYDEALVVIDRICEAHPDSAAPWSMKASIRAGQGNYAEGLNDIDQAIRRSERDPRHWETRAQILRKLGRTAAAEEAEEAAKRYSWFLHQ
jgi:tetratricopeptide (TPR) repeat protein